MTRIAFLGAKIYQLTNNNVPDLPKKCPKSQHLSAYLKSEYVTYSELEDRHQNGKAKLKGACPLHRKIIVLRKFCKILWELTNLKVWSK